MRAHATLDLETDPFKKGRMPKAFASCFYDGKSARSFWGQDCIKKVVEVAMKFDGLIYMHNGGKFDAHFILAEVFKILREKFGDKELKLFCIGARIVCIKTPICEFRDSYALIPKPLSSFGNKKEIDIRKLEKGRREKHKKEIVSYMVQDCVGLYEALKEFFDQYGCEITLASTTFKVLRKQFDTAPQNTSLEFDNQFRKAFYAGRVQFFSLGKHGEPDGNKRFEILDINSAFPWSMTNLHWFSPEYITLEKPPTKYKEQCFYRVHCHSKGALPSRMKNGGVDFPVGYGKFFVSGWELFEGKKLGLITKLKIEAVYQPVIINDFSEYVTHFYDLKKNAKTTADREFAKLMLNSCYGKFALNPREFVDVLVTEYGSEIPWRANPIEKNDSLKAIIRKKCAGKYMKIATYKGERYCLNEDDKLCAVEYWEHSYDDYQRGLTFWQLKSENDESKMRFYNVATAASITSCVRAFLLRSLHTVKNPLYCDTDSIICSNGEKLAKSERLGDWKLEIECDAIWIGGKKLYVAHAANDLGEVRNPGEGNYYKKVEIGKWVRYYRTKKDFQSSWKMASKGVRLSVEDLIAVCEGETRTYSFDAPNYSVFSESNFITRTIRRDDQRKKRGNILPDMQQENRA